MEFNFLLAAAFSFLPSGKLFRDFWLILLSNYIFLCDYAHFWGLDLFKKMNKKNLFYFVRLSPDVPFPGILLAQGLKCY